MKSLRSVTLVDQAVKEIYLFIQRNQMEAGEVLPSEHKLAAILGVSRPVIREALRTLQGKRVVDLVNGKGAIVRPIDGTVLKEYFDRLTETGIDNILQLEESRHGLEMHCAMLAAERGTKDDFRKIEEILNEMRTTLRDKQRYARLNAKFHQQIAKASGNPVLCQLLRSMHDAFTRVVKEIYAQVIPEDHWVKAHEYHEEIYKAIISRDVEKAGRLTLEHLQVSIKLLLEENLLGENLSARSTAKRESNNG